MNPIQTSLSLFVLAAAAGAQDAIVPDHFPTIQAAVVGANDADGDGVVEIFVRRGAYTGNVLVQRSNLSIVGEGPGRTSLTGNGQVEAIRVQNCANVSIANISVHNHGTEDGIELSRVSGVSITGCVTSRCRDGIVLNRSQGSFAGGNRSLNNSGSGIKLGRGSGNTVADNTCISNQSHGIDVAGSDANTITGNVASSNVNNGIRVRESTANALIANTISGNFQSGVRIEDAIATLVTVNAITNNFEWGIRLKNAASSDFASAPGLQGPTGDNTVTGNANGPLRID